MTRAYKLRLNAILWKKRDIQSNHTMPPYQYTDIKVEVKGQIGIIKVSQRYNVVVILTNE